MATPHAINLQRRGSGLTLYEVAAATSERFVTLGFCPRSRIAMTRLLHRLYGFGTAALKEPLDSIVAALDGAVWDGKRQRYSGPAGWLGFTRRTEREVVALSKQQGSVGQ